MPNRQSRMKPYIHVVRTNANQSPTLSISSFILEVNSNYPLIGLLYMYIGIPTDCLIAIQEEMSLDMRKPAFCICKNNDADQLREADQRLCFRYIESTIPLLPKSEISSLYRAYVAAQPGLCRTRSETRTPVFSQRGSNIGYKSSPRDLSCSENFLM